MSTAEAQPAGRSVLVTGGNRGIGEGIARAFLALGDRVAVTTRGGGGPEDTLDVRCDVTDAASVDAAFTQVEEQHGPVEVLVANAGITGDTLMLRMTEDLWTGVLDTNLSGAYRVVKRASRGMLRARGGRVVLVGSVVGLSGNPGQASYAASKAGLVGLARSLTREMGSRGITFNVVAPGFIETDMTAALTEEQATAARAGIPMQRYGRIEEVADAVTWLASSGAGYVNGAVVPVDGGLGMGH